MSRKMFQNVFTFFINCLLKSFTILGETWTIKRQQMAKMNDRILKERLGTRRLTAIFLKITSVAPPQNFRNKKLALM